MRSPSFRHTLAGALTRSRTAFAAGVLALAAAGASAQTAPPAQEAPEIVTAIQTRGNVATSDDELRRLTGVEIGAPAPPDIVEEVTARLRAARRFDRVQVLKRYASIEDPSKIVLVVIVDEGPVSIKRTGDPANPTRVVRKRLPNLLISPILGGESGYGATYGVLLTDPEPAGKNSRIAYPLTWGGTKRAGADFEKRTPDRFITRIEAGGAISRRRNPLFDLDDDREGGYFHAEREFSRALRVRGLTDWQHVTFGQTNDRFLSLGAEGIYDTRLDPFLARNAVFARATYTHIAFGERENANRLAIEGHGYVGLVSQAVLVLSASTDNSDTALPDYMKPLLGGPSSVRGFRTGTSTGDSLTGGSIEVRLPLTSPLSFGKIGVSGFVDAGTVYDADQHIGDQPWMRGAGGSVWFTAAFVRLNVALAHGIGSSTRVQLIGNLTF